jgi:hypothetical protein
LNSKARTIINSRYNSQADFQFFLSAAYPFSVFFSNFYQVHILDITKSSTQQVFSISIPPEHPDLQDQPKPDKLQALKHTAYGHGHP